MFKYKMGFIPIVLAAIIAGGVLIGGGGTYTGVVYYQSNKLIKEADKLAKEGNYADALSKYDKAKHKWHWAKVETKKSDTEELKQLQDYNIEGNKNFGEGEWQKCLEYLGMVTPKFPNYSEVQARYSDCENKLAEQQAAEIAEAEAEKKTAEAEAKKKADEEDLAKIQANNKKKTAAPSTSSSSNSSTNTVESTPTSTSNNTDSAACQSNVSPTFTSHITDISKVESVVIPPRIIGGYLKTHSYLNTNHQRAPIYAPAAMTLYGGVHLSHGSDPDDYGMDFKVSCEVMVRIGHVTDPIQSIKDTFPVATVSSETIYDIAAINFAAGDLIGYTTGTSLAGNWDFGVYNSSTTNRYASNPDWNNSAIYTTAVCPYDYFSASLKSDYSSKYLADFGGTTPDGGSSFCQ